MIKSKEQSPKGPIVEEVVQGVETEVPRAKRLSKPPKKLEDYITQLDVNEIP